MFRRHLQSVATIATIAAVALTATSGIASARGVAKGPGGASAGQKAAKKMHRIGQGGGHTLPTITSGGTTAVAMEAFPTGGAGSGSEETCHQWTIWLNEDEEQVNNATTTVEILQASDQKQADVDAAMDAGCGVIF